MVTVLAVVPLLFAVCFAVVMSSLVGVVAVTMRAVYLIVFHVIIRHPNYIKVSAPEK